MRVPFVFIICLLFSSCGDGGYNNRGYVISQSTVEEPPAVDAEAEN